MHSEAGKLPFGSSQNDALYCFEPDLFVTTDSSGIIASDVQQEPGYSQFLFEYRHSLYNRIRSNTAGPEFFVVDHDAEFSAPGTSPYFFKPQGADQFAAKQDRKPNMVFRLDVTPGNIAFGRESAGIVGKPVFAIGCRKPGNIRGKDWPHRHFGHFFPD
jgi:hypothetical protein